jgi:hypothetical protein
LRHEGSQIKWEGEAKKSEVGFKSIVGGTVESSEKVCFYGCFLDSYNGKLIQYSKLYKTKAAKKVRLSKLAINLASNCALLCFNNNRIVFHSLHTPKEIQTVKIKHKTYNNTIGSPCCVGFNFYCVIEPNVIMELNPMPILQDQDSKSEFEINLNHAF